MSKIIRLGLFLTFVVCIAANDSLETISIEERQEIIPQSEVKKLAKCYDDNISLKIERLERTTQIFEGLISKLLSEDIHNNNGLTPAKNMSAYFELLRQTQIDIGTDLSELKRASKHLNILNEHFKKDVMKLMDESIYNYSSKLTENMTNVYVQQKREFELLLNEKLSSKEIKQLNARDYDENLNCLTKCNVTSELPKNCAAAKFKHDFSDDVHALHIPNSNLRPFYAFCTFENKNEKAWTIIQRREDGSQNFNRNWRDYKRGFGDVYGEYWLGLERLHWMTKNQHHELWIFLVDYDGVKRYAKYSDFSIANENEGYKLNLGKYRGNAGESFHYHNNKKFATHDQDKVGCAERFQSGWWFDECYQCNLNGIFRSFSNQKIYEGIKWNYWQSKSLKYVHMAIRPV